MLFKLNRLASWGVRSLQVKIISPFSSKMVRYISRDEAAKIDKELFTEYRFSVDQLMELAGRSCAVAIAETYPHSRTVLVVCGPGNNGGDGLVCARHLKQFGYQPTVVYPKQSGNELMSNLCHQLDAMAISRRATLPDDIDTFELIVDAIFGFSFKPPLRQPFDSIVDALRLSRRPLISIDVPSGWDVDDGPSSDDQLKPQCLISLTAPKLAARHFRGPFHFVASRFVPDTLAQKYHLQLPRYDSASQSAVRLPPAAV